VNCLGSSEIPVAGESRPDRSVADRHHTTERPRIPRRRHIQGREEPLQARLPATRTAERVELAQVDPPQAGPGSQHPPRRGIQRLAAPDVAARQRPEAGVLPLEQEELQIGVVKPEHDAVH
jgi:hypothetical protein